MASITYSNKIKITAKKLRSKGYSIKQISDNLHIAQSTASIWVRKVILDSKAKLQILKRKEIGKQNVRKSIIKKQKEFQNKSLEQINNQLENIIINKSIQLLLCSFLFWAEGSKCLNNVTFINSDPNMIKTFLTLFRQSFPLDEKKFRATLHLHKYHNEKELKLFWSNISNISINQFTKSYKKPNTGKIKRDNYKGCFRIRYYDAKIAKYLALVHKTFSSKYI